MGRVEDYDRESAATCVCAANFGCLVTTRHYLLTVHHTSMYQDCVFLYFNKRKGKKKRSGYLSPPASKSIVSIRIVFVLLLE